MPESWTIQHFSQANPKSDGEDDVPALLRRVATSIEEFGDITVQDLTFATDITEDGPRSSLTVYFHPNDDAEVRPLRSVE